MNSSIFLSQIYFLIEKVNEIAANTKDAVVAGEKVVEEKLAAAKENVSGKLME